MIEQYRHQLDVVGRIYEHLKHWRHGGSRGVDISSMLEQRSRNLGVRTGTRDQERSVASGRGGIDRGAML